MMSSSTLVSLITFKQVGPMIALNGDGIAIRVMFRMKNYKTDIDRRVTLDPTMNTKDEIFIKT